MNAKRTFESICCVHFLHIMRSKTRKRQQKQYSEQNPGKKRTSKKVLKRKKIETKKKTRGPGDPKFGKPKTREIINKYGQDGCAARGSAFWLRRSSVLCILGLPTCNLADEICFHTTLHPKSSRRPRNRNWLWLRLACCGSCGMFKETARKPEQRRREGKEGNGDARSSRARAREEAQGSATDGLFL